MDKVLVIIVTYNAHKWLRQCLDSVDTKRYDVLVVDNASTDDTLQILCEYPRTMVHKMEINHGFGQANNVGFRYAIEYDYDYVLLLNQDAWLLPDTIDRLIAIQKQHPEYWILSPMQWNTEREGLERHFEHFLSPYQKENVKGVVQVPFVNAAIWLLPISCVEKVGGFDPLFPHYGEDNDYVNRVHYFGGKVGVDLETIAYHEHPLTNAPLSDEQEIYRQMLVYLGVWKDITKPALLGWVSVRCLFLRKVFRNMLSINMKNMKYYVAAWIMAKEQTAAIRKHRELSKLEKAFL